MKNRSECSHHVNGECGECSTAEMKKSYSEFLKYFEIPNRGSDAVRNIKNYLNVKKESHIWEHPLFRAWYGEGDADQILKIIFKAKGPAHTTSLLTNFNIDETLENWEKLGKEIFNKKIKHYSFHMIDFAKDKRKELNNIDIATLMKLGYSSFACVLNTDVSSGRGKHWFCVYCDLEHLGNEEDPMILEFFNSSGNEPLDEIAFWVKKVIDDAASQSLVVKYKKAMKNRVQFSNTECGVWCLVYIKFRLQDKTPEWFEAKITDTFVTDHRKHLFRD
jgi:hypothetical protein